MDTDKLAYEIFAIDPGSFFEILGQPRSEAEHYVFHAVDLKAVERRVDGYFEPKDESRPFYFSEIFFYKRANAYANVFAKVFLKLEQAPTHPWRVAMLFENKSLEPADLSAYAPLLTSGWVHRIYLDELQETSQSGFGLCILKLAATPLAETMVKTRQLAYRVDEEVKPASDREKLQELIEFIAISKLPHLTREEVRAMLNLEDYKKSRFYKEIREEVQEERDVEWIKRFHAQGVSADSIARTMGLALDVVEKVIETSERTK